MNNIEQVDQLIDIQFRDKLGGVPAPPKFFKNLPAPPIFSKLSKSGKLLPKFT